MSKYIGATVVNLSVDTVDVTGDITATDSTPELILLNDTHEDTEGGREGKITFKGEQSGGEVTVLGQIQSSHDGTSDDQKGDLIFKTNDGSDGSSPTERMRIDSDGVVTITRADNGTQLTLKSTDADGSGGPILDLTRDSASPADGDVLGLVRFKGDDAGGNETTYAQMIGFIEDEAAGAEDGTFKIETLIGSSSQARLDMTSTETVFNEGSQDIDFRIESDDNANMFFVNAADDKIGIGTNSPQQLLDVNTDSADTRIRVHSLTNSTPSAGIELMRGTNTTFGTDAYTDFRVENINGGHLTFSTGESGTTTERMRVKGSGEIQIGTTTDRPDNYNGSGSGTEIHPLGLLRIARNGDVAVFNRVSTDGDIISFNRDGTTVGQIGGSTAVLTIVGKDGDAGIGVQANQYGNLIYPIVNVSANTLDDGMDIGYSSGRFDDIYATNGTIQTSDEREKQNIASLTSAEITAATAISKLFKTFKWKSKVSEKGDNARTHTGVVAQQVQTAMSDAGLDAGNYAFFISGKYWKANETYTDDDGVEQTQTNVYQAQEEAPEGATEHTRLGIRYPELLAFIGAATEQRLTSIESRLTALEGE